MAATRAALARIQLPASRGRLLPPVMRRRLLVVDDDSTIRDSLIGALSDPSTEVVAVESAERALGVVGGNGADVVLTDVRMAGLGGVDLLRILRERAPTVDVVLMTAFDD